MFPIFLFLVWSGGIQSQEFTREERAALMELMNAGIMDENMEFLLDENLALGGIVKPDYEVYDEDIYEDDVYNYDDDVERIDEGEDRGGPIWSTKTILQTTKTNLS